MGPEYDLKDAQTQMAIVEAANCMKALFDISGHGLIKYLCEDYLPTLNMDQAIISEYCEALATKDIKGRRSNLYFRGLEITVNIHAVVAC